MADVQCPICGKPNPGDLETCQFCGGPLKSVVSKSIQDSQGSVNQAISSIDKTKPGGSEPVPPGETPTKEKPAEPEWSLSSWLRSLRDNKEDQTGKSSGSKSPGLNLPPLNAKKNTSSDSNGDSSDWLTGLGKAATENEEENPDWLDNLRGDKSGTSASILAPAVEPGSDGSNPSSIDAGGITQAAQTKEDSHVEQMGSPPPEATGSGKKGVPDWLQSFQTKPAAEEGVPDTSQDKRQPSDWLGSILSESASNDSSGQITSFQNEGETLERLDSLKAQPGAGTAPEYPTQTRLSRDESAPEWLGDIPGIPKESTPADIPTESAAPAENLPDWLNQLKGKTISLEPNQTENTIPAETTSTTPDWLSDLESIPATTGIPSEVNFPDWLSNLEDKTGLDFGKPAETPGKEQPVSGTAHDEIPDWISRFNADTNATGEPESIKEPLKVEPESPSGKEDGDFLPDWLSVKKPTATATKEGTPAIVSSGKGITPNDKDEQGFSMETPDWLLKIKPEQATEKNLPSTREGSSLENPEVSELPSWVQAMRPVESVLGEARPDLQDGTGVSEQSGPLAGLNGVLPVGPGLGHLSKPPAYFLKLQATEGQQRYAAALERLVSSETQPQTVKSVLIVSNRLWRWLVTILIILAVGLPLVTNFPKSQATQLKPAGMVDAFTLIGNLQPNAPVLVVFDYQPALAGELEAATTPVMDHLLLQGPRLTLISTSPTGPALAERFLTDTTVSPLIAGHDYKAGQQYVDLGYLAGGPSGIQFFALSPTVAAPFALDGQPAWQLPPLQGVQKLSDFAAILILTDNADTGRIWIEQTATSIGNTPLLMVISAQAEPLLIPYYNSGQVKGMVTGLAGGEEYAQAFVRPDGQSDPAQRYWNSFSVGVLIAVILIVIGALWNAFSGWRTRHPKVGEKA
jgi:hypothetical protein